VATGPEVRFYHLTRKTLEEVLPELLEKSLGRGWRAVVRAGSPERVASLDAHLWSADPQGFLPHGMSDDGHAADQPVWLTDKVENPNGAHVLFLVDGAGADGLDAFQLACILFDGRDAQAVQTARGDWKRLKDGGLKLTYWQQNERGGWAKAAEAG